MQAELGGVYTNPASHGEGRFVATEEWLDKLFANGQVATQYCDPEGNITMDEEWNVNGSYRQLKVSQARMDVSLVRWLMQRDVEICCNEYLRRAGSEDF